MVLPFTLFQRCLHPGNCLLPGTGSPLPWRHPDGKDCSPRPMLPRPPSSTAPLSPGRKSQEKSGTSSVFAALSTTRDRDHIGNLMGSDRFHPKNTSRGSKEPTRSYRVVTRHVLRAIDFGASVVFMAFCTKALLTHFYKDLGMQLQQRKLAVVKDAPSLTAARAIAVRQLSPLPAQSAPHHPRLPRLS